LIEISRVGEGPSFLNSLTVHDKGRREGRLALDPGLKLNRPGSAEGGGIGGRRKRSAKNAECCKRKRELSAESFTRGSFWLNHYSKKDLKNCYPDVKGGH